MKITSFPFQLTHWSKVHTEEHPGETGMAYWKVQQVGEVRVRRVEYGASYRANHWCHKGHWIYYIEGEMVTELQDCRTFTLQKGMSYQVGDNGDAHRSCSDT